MEIEVGDKVKRKDGEIEWSVIEVRPITLFSKKINRRVLIEERLFFKKWVKI